MKKLLLVFSLCILTISLYSQVIYWEDFDGGIPADWEIGPGDPAGAVWQWSATGLADSASLSGTITSALFWGARTAIESLTPENGAAMFNSDVYDGGGTGVGEGPFAGFHSGTLTSPSIDCSTSSSVTLAFKQYARANWGLISTFVEVSNDGGANWTNFRINRDVVSNAGTAPNDSIVINLDALAAGQPDVKIRFTWDGRYYFWLIDDVRLIETPNHNLKMDPEDFFFSPNNVSTPVSQLDTFQFLAQISNFGAMDENNVRLYATIRDANLDTLHLDSLVLEQLPVGTVDSFVVFENDLPVVGLLDTGSYFVTYSLVGDSTDYYTEDNFQFRSFDIVDSLFSKDDDRIFTSLQPGTVQEDTWQMGNYYFLPNPATANRVTFSVSGSMLMDRQVTILLYRLADDAPINFDDSHLEVLGFNTYTFASDDERFDDITVDILDAATGLPGLEIPAGQYIVAVQYQPDMFCPISVIPYTFGIATVVKNGQWFSGGFNPSPDGDATALIRLNISPMIVDVEDTPLKDTEISVYPNPTKELINLSVNLENPSQEMIVRIIDGSGRAILVNKHENVQENIFTYDMSNYPAGLYYFYIRTDEGVKTKRVIVK